MLYSFYVSRIKKQLYLGTYQVAMEKDLKTALLMDIYSGLLTEKQRRLCDMYYNQDYSLSEIAGIEHTTRQAARDGIGKATRKLKSFEESLALCEKRERTLELLEQARSKAGSGRELDEIIDEISGMWANTNGF